MGEPQSYLTVQVLSKKLQTPIILTGNAMKELQFSREKISSKNLSSISSGKIAPYPFLKRAHVPTSYGDSRYLTECVNYYRWCYLSLRGKKISKKLRGDIENGLGTDAEKEDFYAENQLLDELLTLYLHLGQYGKAVDVLEGKGDPDKAWNVITEHIDIFLLQQPVDREVKIRDYARARDFHAILSAFPGDAFLSSAQGSGVSDPWPAGDFWDGLAPTIKRLFKHQIAYGSINSAEKWMKQFIDITVSNPTEHLSVNSTDI